MGHEKNKAQSLYYNYKEINHFALLDNPILIYRALL